MIWALLADAGTSPSIPKSLTDSLHLGTDLSVASVFQGSGKFYIMTDRLGNMNKQLGVRGEGVGGD